MSDQHKYGFITLLESKLLDDLLLQLKSDFGEIRFIEIGVFTGETLRGIYQRAKEIDCPVHCEGVDWEMYKPSGVPEDYVFHAGDSMDAWRNVSGNFNLLFVDGCHCINHSMNDFLNYSPFVDVGGYALFHDSAPNANGEQGEWPQDHSYAGQPPSVLGVRSGLQKMGILQGHRRDWELVMEIQEGDLMGMSLFRKLLPLL